MSVAVRREYTKRGLTPPKYRKGRKHHSQAFHRIAAGIIAAKKRGEAKARKPYAIAMSKLKEKAFKK